MSITATDYAELLEDDCLSPLERSLYESELRRATNRERLAARISDDAKESAKVHYWQQDTLKVMVDLLALQFQIRAWEARKRAPLVHYDAARVRFKHKHAGFLQRLAKARRDSAAGNAAQVEWQLLHAELIAAVSGEPQ